MEDLTRQREEEVMRVASAELFEQAVSRCFYISLVCLLSFFLFGFTSFHFLHEMDPSISLWNNTWPRILFNCVPWILIAIFLKKSKMPAKKKIILWTIFYGILFNITAWIHVWPLALSGHPDVLLYISGSNGAYFFGAWVILAVPPSIMLYCLIINILTIWVPLYTVASQVNNSAVFYTLINDTAFLNILGFVGGYFVSRLYKELAVLKTTQQLETAKFLGNNVYSAIFEGKEELLKEETRNGYILFMDIRDSTQMTSLYRDRWETFGKEWMAAASKIVPAHRGSLLKTGGDSLLITFGVFDEAPVDLSDIPGIEREEIMAEERRWKELTFHCFNCTHKLIEQFQLISDKHFPEHSLRIGAGIDRGPVKRGLRGSEHKMELDIWGDRVNCAARLQDYAKNVATRFDADSSVLIVSPFACDYIDEKTDFRTTPVDGSGIKDFPGIKWVLAREYKYRVRNRMDPGIKAV